MSKQTDAVPFRLMRVTFKYNRKEPTEYGFTDYDTVDLHGRVFLVLRLPDVEEWLPFDDVESFSIQDTGSMYVAGEGSLPDPITGPFFPVSAPFYSS